MWDLFVLGRGRGRFVKRRAIVAYLLPFVHRHPLARRRAAVLRNAGCSRDDAATQRWAVFSVGVDGIHGVLGGGAVVVVVANVPSVRLPPCVPPGVGVLRSLLLLLFLLPLSLSLLWLLLTILSPSSLSCFS